MNLISEQFVLNNIKNIVFTPDSLGTNFIRCLMATEINLLQVLNESDGVTISSGLNLTGDLTICMMENSGLRSACEFIVRLEKLNHIFNFYIISQRGGIGEENWWGVSHNVITNEIIDKLNFKYCKVEDINDFITGLKFAVSTFKTEQCSVALFLTKKFLESLKGEI